MKKSLKLSILTPFVLVLMFTLANCSRFDKLGKSEEEASSNSSSTGDSSSTNSDFDIGSSPTSQKVNLPYALMSASQMLSSMFSAAAVLPDSNIKAEFNSRYAMLPDGNDLELTNAPFLLSATSIAGAVCQEAYERERRLATATERVVFRNLNFGGPSAPMTDQDFNSLVRGMARLFWGRNETAEELKYLQEFKTEFMKDPANTNLTNYVFSKNFASSVCGAMLSSVDAITY